MRQARRARAGSATGPAEMRRVGLWLMSSSLLLACGQGQAPQSSGAAMAAPEASDTNRPPEILRVGFSPAQPEPGAEVTAVVRASDPDGDPVQLAYRWEVAGDRVASSAASIPMPELRRGQSLRLSVIAGDGRAESAPMSAELEAGNRPPRLLGLDIETRPLGSGSRAEPAWFAEAEAEDPDGDLVSFRYDWLVNGRVASSDTNSLAKSRLKRGDRVQVRVVAMDAQAEGAPLESAVVEINNSAPDIVSTPPDLDASGVFRYPLVVEDRDGDKSFSYRLDEAPEGMQIDPANGELSWRPGSQDAGRHSVKVTVDDGHGALTTQSFFVSVQLAAPSSGPAALR